MPNENRIGISISLDNKTLKLIDEERGRIPRSRYIEDKLVALVNPESDVSKEQLGTIEKVFKQLTEESLDNITKELREKYGRK